MKVLWLAYGSLDQPTGGYVYDRLVVEGLRAHGDDVWIADPRERPASATRHEAFDVVVGDALCIPHLDVAFAAAAGAARVLLVHHLTSWEVESAPSEAMRARESAVLRGSDRLAVTGEATAARLVAEHAGTPIDVIVPGADRLARAPRAAREPGAPLRLLFVGSLVPRKRVELLLDALEAVAGVHLRLVGDAARDPTYAAALRSRIEGSPGLASRVMACGVVDEATLAVEMATADALVLPSSLEGYGMVMTEALHARLPVLASKAAVEAAGLAGHPAVIAFEGAASLRDRIGSLARDPALRTRLAERAAEQAETSSVPRWSDAAAAFRACLERAISAARARGPATAAPR